MSDLLNRLVALEEKAPRVNARLMRGGMQKRLHRQEVIRFRNDIQREKDKITATPMSTLRIFSASCVEQDEFKEPVMRRIRNKRGFF